MYLTKTQEAAQSGSDMAVLLMQRAQFLFEEATIIEHEEAVAPVELVVTLRKK